MPSLLRFTRQNRWDVYTNAPLADKPWLERGELQADIFLDLQTDSNELSVWEVEAEDELRLYRIIAALTARRTHLAVFDYALVDRNTVEELGIAIHKRPGDTNDQGANENWHYDLVELTADKLLALARAISEKRESKRISRGRVQEYINNSLIRGYLAWNDLSENIQKKIPRP